VIRQLMGHGCGLVRATNPCRCDKLVRASVDAGILDPADPRWARHAGVTLPIETTTLDTGARELDLAVAVAEVYLSDPRFTAPETVWAGLASALPTLLARPEPVVSSPPHRRPAATIAFAHLKGDLYAAARLAHIDEGKWKRCGGETRPPIAGRPTIADGMARPRRRAAPGNPPSPPRGLPGPDAATPCG
jgi:hypothetical protein